MTERERIAILLHESCGNTHDFTEHFVQAEAIIERGLASLDDQTLRSALAGIYSFVDDEQSISLDAYIVSEEVIAQGGE